MCDIFASALSCSLDIALVRLMTPMTYQAAFVAEVSQNALETFCQVSSAGLTGVTCRLKQVVLSDGCCLTSKNFSGTNRLRLGAFCENVFGERCATVHCQASSTVLVPQQQTVLPALAAQN